MNPIASQGLPAVPREGNLGPAPVRPVAAAQDATTAAFAAQTATVTRAAPAPAQAGGAGSEIAERRVAGQRVSDTRVADQRLAETSDEANRAERRGAIGKGDEERLGPNVRPAPPLKSFATIPTAMMEEIERLRQEAAERAAKGVEGRADPTPVPAREDAIGPALAER